MQYGQRCSRVARVCLAMATAFAVACSGSSDADVVPITQPDSAGSAPGIPSGVTPVATVVVTIDSTSLSIGHSSPTHAVVKDGAGNVLTGRDIVWSSSDPSVATVASGVVTAVGAGNASISAKVDDVTGTSTVTVPVVPAVVASVVVTLDSSSLSVGHTTATHAVAKDANGAVITGRAITWASSNPGIAAMTLGVVVGATPGSSTISATVDGVTGSVSLTITAVPVTQATVASVVVTIDSSSLAIGHVAAAHATAKDSDGNVITGRPVTWASTNAGVAAVNFGVVTAVGVGTAGISAKIDGVTGSANVAVIVPPVATVSVSIDSASLAVGHIAAAHAVAKDADGTVLNGRTITWSSSNTGAATVNSSGMVTAVAAGNAAISASVGGVTGSENISVALAAVASVTVTLDSSTMAPGHTAAAHAVAKDAGGNVLTGRTITWSSSNTAAATVASSGVVTSVAQGTASISARIGGVTGSASLTVTAAPQVSVATVAVTVDSSSFTAGHTAAAHATAKDASGNVLTGRTVTWASSNTAAATVASSGIVTGVAAGTSSISATVGGVTGSASITITAAASGSFTRECDTPGSGWIFCDDFESDRTAKYFEYDNAGGKFVRTTTAGVTGSVGMRARYTTGETSAGSLKLAFGKTPDPYFKAVDAGTSNYREIYWRFYIKLESGWVGNGAVKMTRATSFSSGDWSQAMIAHGWTGPDDRYLAIDPASGTDEAGNVITSGYNDFTHLRWLGLASTNVMVEDQSHVGVWQCLEFHVKLNDAGSTNGVFDVKVNGQTAASRTGLNWVGSYNAYGLNAIFLEQFVNDGAPANNTRTFDNFVVSTSPIGCPANP